MTPNPSLQGTSREKPREASELERYAFTVSTGIANG